MPQEIDKISPVRKLQEWDARTVAEVIESRGETTIVIAREQLLKVAGYLATEPALEIFFSFGHHDGGPLSHGTAL